MAYIKHILDLIAKNQIKIFFFFLIYKKLKKQALRLIKNFKKAHFKRAFVRAVRFRGKKPQGLYALRFALKRAFNNTV